ncbi:bifunctional serine/threonine-protein kinase/ABC transporter substrate-binding protein [Streptomyces sp. WMMC500]|uniref:bifunctional serine/threonine-protein kinase/ABC transporter substrate-binding protein n=1 Tax=Streptomyces sp. WMMC500 TaxID=3015154 RepID=UPI00248BDB55|nr:bifunctional serine/threonine-protein kinase/ABC transporter substrate-binding protein [Streptomyces sp. WMMC500]WBB61618.1 bifunctional serine/threonine-protein kinase/ABC transporter substrate-binding protein [Streptomyces sp. WMMC500]
MRALRADDPDELGGHRLLARLGAGGMGVVYLARGGDGALVALKVIRPEHAANQAFRARFRREVRLASGLTGRWVVPVTAADAEARAPWLATAFVPGPALVEAVDGYGPLPPYAVASLGARLAEALAEVHAAGLVHRDVKPGNVLLALDGPRLIDFGIAHDSGATALTAPDAVIGTPGYLAPEQIRTGGRAGPPSDVFALGCVLAYAATGRRPYGTGNAAAVLYRTVHEAPDLAGLERLPRGLRTAITACLAKAPDDRPTAAELRTTLATEPAAAAAPEPAAPADPRVPAPPPPDAATRVLRDVAPAGPASETLPYVEGDAAGGGGEGGGPEGHPGGDPHGGDRAAEAGEAHANDRHAAGTGDPRSPGVGAAAGRSDGPGSPPDDQPADVPRAGSGEPPAPGVRAADGPRGRAPAERPPGVPTGPAPAPVADPPNWLPSPVLRLVAERSARALDPPVRQTAVADAVPAPAVDTTAPGGGGPSRRRFLVVGGSAAAVLAASGAGAAALFATRGGGGNGGASQSLPTHAIAVHAALTGPQKGAGVAQERGARLAVARHNARDDARFRLSLVPYDDGGEPGRARDVARQVLAERAVRALLGPTTVETLRVAVPLYAEESMAAVNVSVDAAAAGLSRIEAPSLVSTRLSGAYHAHPILDYLTRVHGVERTAVVEDRAAGDAVRGVLTTFRESPPSEGEVSFHPVAASAGFESAVAAALAERPEAVVFAGASAQRGAACARALAAAGFDGPRTTFERMMRPEFLHEAGEAAEGWVFGAPYTAAEQGKSRAARDFTAAYRERYEGPPPRWAAEAYDAVGLIAAALDALGGGAEIVPGQVAERIVELNHAGVAKPLRFTEDLLHMLQPEKSAFLYEVRDGAFRFLGRHDQVK